MRLVLDTNVLVAAMRSPRGASAALLNSVSAGRAEIACNPALFLEYEQTMKRMEHLAAAGISADDVDTILRRLASVLIPAPPFRRLRPQLTDPDDDMVLEAAIGAGADAIVTFELATFRVVPTKWRIDVLAPRQALAILRP
jgi:putative PIN family toxin of toxin-antitoxin system